MKKKLMTLLSVTLFIVFGAAQTAAGWGGGMDKEFGAHHQINPEKWQSKAEILNLTDEQSSQIKKIHQEHFNNTRDLREKLQKAMFDLRLMSWEKSPDRGKLNEKINEVNSLRSQLYKARQSCRERVSSVLTPEQRAKLNSQCPDRR